MGDDDTSLVDDDVGEVARFVVLVFGSGNGYSKGIGVDVGVVNGVPTNSLAGELSSDGTCVWGSEALSGTSYRSGMIRILTLPDDDELEDMVNADVKCGRVNNGMWW